MNEELDDDLKRRIGEVFNNYEDHGANEGWMLLREKFPAPAKHRGIARLWWASAAAVLLLLVGAGMWLNYRSNDQTVQVAQKHIEKKKQTEQVKSGSETPSVTKKSAVEVVDPANEKVAGDYLASGSFKPSAPALSSEPNTDNTLTISKDAATKNIITDITIADVKKDDVVPTAKTTSDPSVTPVAQQTVPVYAETKPDVKTPVTENKPVITQAPQQSPANSAILSMLEKDSYAQNAKEKKVDNKAVHLGVYAATYMNYAKGSDSRMNVGAGVSSDFRITKNLKLSTGISIAQNSFNYNTGGGDNTGLPQAAVAQASTLQAEVFSDNKGFSSLLVTPSLQNYNARLVGLDVPVNLKYEFSPEKNDTYISAGLSSGTFLNESYTYRYGYNGPVSASTAQPADEKINSGFGNFYFARTLNVAFGIGYPLGKSNRLVIEPFLKYPLEGMGAQQIKFGSGGINLKLNFQTRKK